MKKKPSMEIDNIEGLDAYLKFSESMREEYSRRQALELNLIANNSSFTTNGYCYVCKKDSVFKTDFLYSDPNDVVGTKRIPNWRERVECQGCLLTNRIRSSIQFLEEILCVNSSDEIYITEQTSQLYSYMKAKYTRLRGSEYLGEEVPFGEKDQVTGAHNESITKLTFDSDSFDFILSFDVFEHVPLYASALKECHRCLKHGGVLLFSVPFNKFSQEHLIRAKMHSNGEIEHYLEPEYHGDPLNDQGCLSFYCFGWDLFEELRRAGFTKVQAHLFWSEKLGYLGNELTLFSAVCRQSVWNRLRFFLRELYKQAIPQ